MLIKSSSSGFDHPVPSEITPHGVYHGRRDLIKLMATGAAGAAMAGWAGRQALAQTVQKPGKLASLAGGKSSVAGAVTLEKITDYKDATTYNNFYEFGTDKSDPAKNAGTLVTKPWSVAIEGMVKQPRTYTLEELLKLSPQEERIYRLRCVEGWSMVIPWVGYSLSELIKKVEPLGSAKYVEFITQADPKTMPFVGSRVLDWPYVEALRMDEAMHPLALLAFGKIRFTDKEPRTAWNKAAASEYGFYSNVNPQVDHPRWSQATERRIGEDGLFAKKRKTLMFNGYEAQVGQLYAGMDLKKFF